MKKRLKKLVASILAATLFLSAFAGAAGALSLKDSVFYLNAPTYIALNSSMDGSISERDDYACYITEVKKNGALTVKLDHEQMAEMLGEGWRITLYSMLPDGNGGYKYDEITYFESFWMDVTSLWGETGVKPGYYLIVVEPAEFFVMNTYTLVVSFSETEYFEREFNDTPETANEIALNWGFYGSSSQRTDTNDIDYYKAVMKSDGVLNISFSHEDKSLPNVGWIVTLLTEDGVTLSELSSKYADAFLSTGDIGLKAGTYYIRVTAQMPLGITYKIMASSGSVSNTEFEPNDSPETAVFLEPDNSKFGNLSARVLGLDKDYYKITVPENGYADVFFTHAVLTDEKIGWNVRILKQEPDGSYYEIIKRSSAWNDGGVSIRRMGLAAGDYYILVDADSASPNPERYSLSWSFSKNDYCELEPNDTLIRATKISVNQKYYGSLQRNDMRFDKDYYEFTVTQNTPLCFEFFHSYVDSPEVSWTVSIVDEGYSAIVSAEITQNRSAFASDIVTLVPGTYYLAVEPGLYENASEYSFSVTA